MRTRAENAAVDVRKRRHEEQAGELGHGSRAAATGGENRLLPQSEPDAGRMGSACDAVLKRAARREPQGREMPWGKLAWHDDFELADTRTRPSKRGRPIDRAVEDLLAAYSL